MTDKSKARAAAREAASAEAEMVEDEAPEAEVPMPTPEEIDDVATALAHCRRGDPDVTGLDREHAREFIVMAEALHRHRSKPKTQDAREI